MRSLAGSRRALVRRAAVLAAAVGTLLGGAATVAAAAPSRATRVEAVGRAAAVPVPRNTKVVIWGDSLAWEAREYLTFLGAANGMPTEVRSFGGTATCDWFGDMRAHLRAARPAVVVLAFSGNNLTSCMRPTGSYLYGNDLAAKYEVDTAKAVRLARARGAKVVLVGAPRSQQMTGKNWDTIHRALESVADQSPTAVHYADGGRLIAPRGRWSMRQPCLPREFGIVSDGKHVCNSSARTVVRAPDGAHFCPGGWPAVNGITRGCPRYSSGAYRYASTIVREAHRQVYGRYP